MNINSSSKNESTIDFSTLSLKALREMLPSTEGVNTPSEVWIREHADEILCSADFEGAVIHVYRNGFYTYTKDRHTSILRVDGFHRLRYDFIGLLINGENQWECNEGKRSNYRHEFYIEGDGEDWNDECSVPSAEDEVMEREDEREERERLRKAMDKLTDRQREIVNLYYFHKLTQEEIAKRLGIRQQSVLDVLNAAIKRLQKKF